MCQYFSKTEDQCSQAMKQASKEAFENNIYIYIFFSIWVFFHEHSRITGLQEKGEGISLTPHYHFHPLHRRLDISRAIAAESSPLHIARHHENNCQSLFEQSRVFYSGSSLPYIASTETEEDLSCCVFC